MASNYGPRFFGSQVLPDGRVEIIGGEYNFFAEVETSQGAIYNPNFGAWRSVTPPLGWTMLPTGGTGDSQSVVLNNGIYLQANCCDFPGGEPTAALLNATNLTWTFTGNFKFDSYNEEGWTLLPNGNVLTVDAYAPNLVRTCGSRPPPLTGQNNSEIYNGISGDWTSVTSSVGVQLADCTPAPLGQPQPSFELGPTLLRRDGTVIAFGGTTQGTAHTSIFDSSTSTWTPGPDIPSVVDVVNPTPTPYTLADAPAALLPSGNVLFAASPSNWGAASNLRFPCPTHFFEVAFGTNTITQVTDNPDGIPPNTPCNPANKIPGLNSFQWNFLVLPTGQILAVETDTPNVWVYNPSGNPNPAWAPVINTHPSVVSRGFTYQLTGTQFNGLSQGAAYGDDVQGDTDRPIVKIVNSGTGHVFYQRTSGYTISLAPGAPSSTNFQVTGVIETGASTLFVIANGISSAGVAVTVAP